MIWDWLVQRTGKYCSIRRIEYPELQTGIFGRMETAPRRMSYAKMAERFLDFEIRRTTRKFGKPKY